MALCKGVFIVGAKTTPFCSYGGPFRDLTASRIFAAAAKDAMRSADLDPTIVDCTVVGNVNFLSQCDGGKTPRYCGIYSGVPIERPALGVNKACGTGLQAIITGGMKPSWECAMLCANGIEQIFLKGQLTNIEPELARLVESHQEILTGSGKVCLVGGTELMSSLPFLVRNVRFGTNLGTAHRLDNYIKRQSLDSYCGFSMQKIAETVAERYKLRRDSVDQFTLQSYHKWKSAHAAKLFGDEITHVTVDVDEEEIVLKDDIPRSVSMLEELSTLPPSLNEGSIITSGNSSASADGAAALILASEESVNQHKLTPLARLTAWSCVGVDPVEAGLGAIPAISKLLTVSNKNIQEVDLFEINETFAAQAMAVIEELKIDPSKVNISGGALSIGHPVAATGARMATHLAHQIRRNNARTAIAASSCGGVKALQLCWNPCNLK